MGILVKKKFGGIYGEGAKKRYRNVEEMDDMEIEEIIKKFVIGGVF